MTLQVCADPDEAVAGIASGSTVLVGGFGLAGMPVALVEALVRQGADGLTVVSNNAGNGDTGLAALLAEGRVRKVVCSFPRQHDSYVFDELYRAGETSGRMMSIGLHPHIIGRAFRARAIREFLDYAKKFDGVWWATREEIADWYLQNHKQHIG